MAQRNIAGHFFLPSDAVAGETGSARVELRDVSVQDAPSILLASADLANIDIQPGAAIRFMLRAPDVDTTRSLSLRVQLDAATPGSRGSGYLTTQSWPVAPTGNVDDLAVMLQKTD